MDTTPGGRTRMMTSSGRVNKVFFLSTRSLEILDLPKYLMTSLLPFAMCFVI